MRYKKIYKIAIELDERNHNRNVIIKKLVKFNAKYLDRGKYKRAFLLEAGKRKFVFKYGSPEDIKNQSEIYQELKGNRKIKYAKIYWNTYRSMLQPYCEKFEVSNDDLNEGKREAKRLGYTDYRPANVGEYRRQIVAFDLTKKNILREEK